MENEIGRRDLVFNNNNNYETTSPSRQFRENKNHIANNRFLQQNKEPLVMVKKEKPITLSLNNNNANNGNLHNMSMNKNIKQIIKQVQEEKESKSDSNFRSPAVVVDRSTTKNLSKLNFSNLTNIKSSLLQNNNIVDQSNSKCLIYSSWTETRRILQT